MREPTGSFFQQFDTELGPIGVHVNRRGCTGEWTAESQAALEALVVAVVKMHQPPAGERTE